MKRVRQSVWRKVAKDTALIEQDGRCKYCKRPLRRDAATADHVVPSSKNGRDDRTNLVAACHECNCAKGSMAARPFTRMVRGHEAPPNYGIAVRAMMFRIEKRLGQAVANILAVVGERP